MTLAAMITLTITGVLVLAAALIAAFLIGRHADRVRLRRERRRIQGEINTLLEVDGQDWDENSYK